MKELYSIKEFSDITKIPTDTLRYYDKIDLFKPSFKDPNTSYRYYTLKEFEQIGVIQTLQKLGLSLNEIKNFESNKTFFSSYKLLKNQYEEISCKITEMQTLQKYLEEKISILDLIIKDSVAENIVVKNLPKRIAYSSNIICKNYSDIKIESARIIENYSKSLFISSSYGIHIPKDDLLNGNYISDFYCAILDIKKPEINDFCERIYNKGKYVCLKYNGTSFQRQLPIEKMLRYIEENNLTIIGDAIQLCIVDENLTNLDHEKVNEIQIPVK